MSGTLGSFGGAFFDYVAKFPKALSWTPKADDRRPGQVVLERLMDEAADPRRLRPLEVFYVSAVEYRGLLDELARVVRYYQPRYLGMPLTIQSARGPVRVEVSK